MKVLFVHNNFPGQFRHIARELSEDPQNLVAAIGCVSAQDMPNVVLRRYELGSFDLTTTHPFARRFDLECRRAEQVLYAASELARIGFYPDLIMVHSGWGENHPLRAVFPRAKIIVYCEFFYRAFGQDVDFDPEFPRLTADGRMALHLKNATQLLAITDADAGLSPTLWQRATFPEELQSKIAVIHEGVDTRVLVPNPQALLRLPDGTIARAGEEIITFVARNLEPLRGYHIFLRAIVPVLRARPQARVIIIGSDGISYGMPPPEGRSWKDVYLDEVRSELDLSRVHFLGAVPYETFVRVLQVSAAHVYLTYPFVLSWSFIEAMSCGCLVLAGDVPPTREVLDHTTGILVPFYNVESLAEMMIEALRAPETFEDRRRAARQKAVDEYDLTSRTLPALRRYMDEVLARF